MASKPHSNPGEGIKQRINRCLNKLSDRDTEAMAVAELESIALSLTPELFTPFLSAISDTRPTDKTPLRRHSLRLLSLLSAFHPYSSLAPHLSRMLSAALRRLRDPDSSVRASCVDAVRSISALSAGGGCGSAVLLRPLADALLHEQDYNAQIASALCLAAAVDAASAAGDPRSDLASHLQRILPRFLKLLRSNAFKAKPALLSVIGSVAAAGGAHSPALVGILIPCLREFLYSEDWAARKAAAEALTLVAISEKDLLAGFKTSCLSSFESRRFDKVKIVRDSMSRMLEVWKEIPATVDGDSNAVPPSKSQSNPSPRESKNRFLSSRSPPPDASPIVTSRRNIPSIGNKKLSPPLTRKTTGSVKSSDWKVEVAVLTPPVKIVTKEKLQQDWEQGGAESNDTSRLKARGMLFEHKCEEKGNKLAGMKAGSREVPLQEKGRLELIAGNDSTIDEINAGHKDCELSLIRMQLVQIENRQSSLLDLLQRFIGSSQNGIHSLETRVHGLEMAVDGISRDLTLYSGRMLNDDEVNTCCRFPGTEFLSSKLWRRHEGKYSARFSISDLQNLSVESRAPYKWDKQRFGRQGGFVINPLADINPHPRGSIENSSHKIVKGVIHDTVVSHTRNGKQDAV
ncbi:TORTIFOLIA1-like protein 5 [Typha angustifolia]|uniref:TORTIFOLIA1-like protein 5 n=1 Tax=Typha angustifolia TaxID=59011 RepID=UPI003C2EA679